MPQQFNNQFNNAGQNGQQFQGQNMNGQMNSQMNAGQQFQNAIQGQQMPQFNGQVMQQGEIQPNQHVFIEGTISFSALSELIDGERLKERNAHRRFSMPPYTQVTMINPKIIPMGAHKPQLTPSELYIQSRRFTPSKKDPNTVYFSADSRVYNGNYDNYRLPWVAFVPDGSKVATQYRLHKGEELERGQKAIVVLRTFASNTGRNGIVLSGVLVFAEQGATKPKTRSFDGSSEITNDLQALGYTLQNPAPQEYSEQPVSRISTKDLPLGMQQSIGQNNQQQSATNNQANMQSQNSQLYNAGQTPQPTPQMDPNMAPSTTNIMADPIADDAGMEDWTPMIGQQAGNQNMNQGQYNVGQNGQVGQQQANMNASQGNQNINQNNQPINGQGQQQVPEVPQFDEDQVNNWFNKDNLDNGQNN